ncbi:hypothetical protein PM082_016515 [Marasmius tenuissimus]|nr:hypothetical protein PM082_016515 [Marasmius tenuissimus]
MAVAVYTEHLNAATSEATSASVIPVPSWKVNWDTNLQQSLSNLTLSRSESTPPAIIYANHLLLLDSPATLS